MSKIKIISHAEQGVTIDISGCRNADEARSYLSSTLQVSSQFWQGLAIDLTLGDLTFTREEAERMLSILKEVGVNPRFINSDNPATTRALRECAPIEPQLVEETACHSTSVATAEAMTSAEGLDIPTTGSAVAVLTAPGDTLALSAQIAEDLAACIATKIEVPTLELVSSAPAAQPAQSAQSSQSVQSAPDALPASGTSIAIQPAAIAVTPVSVANITGSVSVTPLTKPQTERQPAVLLLKQHLRSGQAVSHSGHLVIIGDVNPGAEITADGDITVWGTLRGMAHAGAGGNTKAEVRALRFEAIQLRIANAIARAPDRTKLPERGPKNPETARIVDGKIRISASDPE